MPTEFRGQTSAPAGRFAIVVSRYNETVTRKLLDGAIATLRAAGIAEQEIEIAWVPGAFEIPLAARAMAGRRGCSAVLCLGAVVRGETTHDRHINRAVSMGISQVALETGVPVLFGVLTCESLEQAIERSGGRVGNKGVECAEAALEMASLLAQLRDRA